MIRLFPAVFGEPDLVKVILVPLPQPEPVPVGGVNLGIATGSVKEEGAAAFGVGII